MIHNNILETIGNTPVVRLNNMAPDGIGRTFIQIFSDPTVSADAPEP